MKKQIGYDETTPEGVIRWTFIYRADGTIITKHELFNKPKGFVFR